MIFMLLFQVAFYPGLAEKNGRQQTVGSYPKRICVADFQKIGDLIENAGNVRIMNRHGDSWATKCFDSTRVLMVFKSGREID